MITKGKILAVDDTPSNLEVITETLGDAGYRVATAIDGLRALKRAQLYQPDLILLDIMMPGIDGLETCKRLKADPTLSHIPVIFITASSDLEMKVRGFQIGGTDYITKPFHEEEMLARVANHLRLKTLNQQLEEKVAERTQQLEQALDKLNKSQLQLVKQEKMSALGNLMAGIAHEINNPIGAIAGNAHEAELAIAELLTHLTLYRQQQSTQKIQQHAEAISLDFLVEDIPKILKTISVSCDRVCEISQALSLSARRDNNQKTEFDLNKGLESTLMILGYRLKAMAQRPAIQVLKGYEPLPKVHCYPGQINQVFINILSNAIDACEAQNLGKTYQEIEANPNIITIQTSVLNDQVQIQIKDNGCGMDADVKKHIFEQGFTTKVVGKGTGLGMAIARQIIEETHGGSLSCTSQIGKGSIFTITLPQ